MDMVKQALMGIVASMALGGCLTDPNIVYVPDTQEEEADQDEDNSQGAAWWPADRLPLEWGVPTGQPNGSALPGRGALLAQSMRPGHLEGMLTATLNRTFVGARVKGRRQAYAT